MLKNHPTTRVPFKEPEAFTGEQGHLEPFLAQVNVFLQLNPGYFINDSDQILWLSTLLCGVAHQWFYPHLSATNPPVWLADNSLFVEQLRTVFGEPDHIAITRQEIKVLSQTTSASLDRMDAQEEQNSYEETLHNHCGSGKSRVLTEFGEIGRINGSMT
ncbi:hypothetical protein NDA11_001304 [Ustilago hordei]|uniref:DUF4939 domain-containing protein n=1 Tax=Ustilago hordei TaxID=120017 RepID=I2FSQ0_USTHO|nr:hypothetical protein NDA10_006441 [Ustilago hordei]KAJ1570574.1 hypothetical protein NDA11_001304 [Ustilago hordei]KAJ1587008.1 hypothetical protein NDA15_001119 [Ustilago hordei]KAJ1589742.1 hypothetical protein NDA12_000468 [Ustilago hordei]UTT96674.1 hypothetical protein NDA17_002796 [Ustilago hordei]